MLSTPLRRRLVAIVILMVLTIIVWGWVIHRASQPEMVIIVPAQSASITVADNPMS